MKDSNRLVQVYLSPEGNDDWNGVLSKANDEKSEGPVATFSRAMSILRQAGEDVQKKLTVEHGNYYQTSIQINEEDSHLIIESAAGASPVLYGGFQVSRWIKEEHGPFWFAEIPKHGNEPLNPRLLSMNGRFCQRARYPETGELIHLTEFKDRWLGTFGGGWGRKLDEKELDHITYQSGDLVEWLDINNAELTIYHEWDETLVGIKAHVKEDNKLLFSNLCGHPPGAFNRHNYVVWNIREGMTKPGQWYLDRTAGRIVYWPLQDEDMEACEAYVPAFENIIRFSGNVHNVCIKGLGLTLTNTPLKAGGFGAGELPGAVESLESVVDCTFENLTIYNVAGHGIKLVEKSDHIAIRNCEIMFTGAGGIWVSNSDDYFDKLNDEKRCTSEIYNNCVRDIGLIYPSSIGIMSRNYNVLHNEVRNTPYTGINAGGDGARIEYNYIENVMNTLNDGSAIYTIGAKNGVIRRNVIKKGCLVDSSLEDSQNMGEKSAIYLDEYSMDWLVEENLSIDFEYPSFNHIASGNRLKNNWFISRGDMRVYFTRCKSYILERNIFHANGSLFFITNDEAIEGFDKNILFSGKDIYRREVMKEYECMDTIELDAGNSSMYHDLKLEMMANGICYWSDHQTMLDMGILPFTDYSAGRV